MLWQWNPITVKRWQRFRSIRRGYYSFVLFWILVLLSLVFELLINNRALVVHYQGNWFFPTYGSYHAGTEFGLDYDYEVNYRELQTKLAESNSGDFVVMPLVPWGPYEIDLPAGENPPFPPSVMHKHYLGTDIVGRDILARLAYGFRTAIFFALFLLVATFVVGIAVGCLMGYWGGWFDLFFQRLIEIWNNIPFLYVIIIVASIMVPNFPMLVGIMIFFGWTGMTWYMRTVTYKERSRDYVLAAQTLGASTSRIVFRHILPNTVSVIVTFIPFAISGAIISLTSLDFLGFGLPSPTPSWGELLQQGTQQLHAQWIVGSVVTAMVIVLTMITFIGEAVREAFDPKKHTTYE